VKATGRAREGWEGWDDYAAFYDWENARTLGKRDVPFWERLARQARTPVLELGCGTGRITLPLAKAGITVVGLDRSESMLARARKRVTRAKLARRARLVRGDIRHLPFAAPGRFRLVMAPYGILQSLLREADLVAALRAAHAVLAPGGIFGLELVADLPSWAEYRDRVTLRGWRGRPGGVYLTLCETVVQDRAKGITRFEQTYEERRGRERRTHRFSLAFRTVTVPQMTRRLESAGFEVTAVLGDYQGGPWDPRAEAWILLACKK